MDLKYLNSIIFESYENYRRALNYKDLKAIVIYKDPVNWLESIRKWGYICNWIQSENEFSKVWPKWIKEYSDYYIKWKQFSKDPNVLFIQYEDLVFNFEKYIDKITNLLAAGILVKDSPKKVNHSSRRTYTEALKDIQMSCFSNCVISEIYSMSRFSPRLKIHNI
jgi:hypothetical protein